MDIAAVAAITLLVLLTAWWVLKPFWQEPTITLAADLSEQRSLAELYHRRDAVYKSIKDLELDLASGKLSEADSNLQRSQFVAEAADILRQIDRLSQLADEGLETQIDSLLAGFESNGAGTPDPLREEIRLKIRQALAGQGGTGCPQCGYTVDADDAFCRKCGAQLEHQCSACGEAVGAGDLFCAHCGEELAVEATE